MLPHVYMYMYIYIYLHVDIRIHVSRLIDGTVDDMSVLGGHRGSYRIAAGPLPADANPTECQYVARSGILAM